MRIHTDKLDRYAIGLELRVEHAAGRIAEHVTFKRLDRFRSSIRDRAYEIQLQAGERDRGRRAGNSGSYGAMRPEYDGYAATFDEWGWLLAGLFSVDPDMVVGSPKTPTYDGRADFHDRTGLTYNPLELIRQIDGDADEYGPLDPYPFIIGRSGEGRRGYGRTSVDRAYDYSYSGAQAAYVKWLDNPNARTGNDRIRFVPRTVEQVREFAHLAPEVTA